MHCLYYILPITEDPRQVFTLDLTIDGEPFHARVEIRYLPAPDTGIRLLSFPGRDPVFSRGQAFCGHFAIFGMGRE